MTISRSQAACLLSFLILSVFFPGCVTRPYDPMPSPPAKPQPRDEIVGEKDPLTKIDHVFVGMSYQDVVSIMGDRVVVGYEMTDEKSGAFQTITVPAPFREDEVKAGDTVYRILFYFTGVSRPDGLISEEELVPLIFEGDRLIGKGTDVLFQLRNP